MTSEVEVMEDVTAVKVVKTPYAETIILFPGRIQLKAG